VWVRLPPPGRTFFDPLRKPQKPRFIRVSDDFEIRLKRHPRTTKYSLSGQEFVKLKLRWNFSLSQTGTKREQMTTVIKCFDG